MNQPTFGENVNQFLEDVKRVYPGPIGKAMELKRITLPTAEEMGIGHLMPARPVLQQSEVIEMIESDEWDERADH